MTTKPLALALLGIVGCNTPAAAAELLSSCPPDQLNCVVMTLDALALGEILIERVDITGGPYADFTLRVPTRTANGDPGPGELTVRGFVDGMQCSAFGQATVAVVGFAENRAPIVLSTDGPLVLEGPALLVGCPDCARLMTPAGEVLGFAATLPSWDLSLVGIPWRPVAYRDDGTLFVAQRDRCLEIPTIGMVEDRPAADCVAPAGVAEPSAATSSAPGAPGVFAPYAWPGRSNMLHLDLGGCT